MGRKTAKARTQEIIKLKQDMVNSKNAINSLSDSIGSMREIGRLRTEAISDIADRLMVVENLLQPALNDVVKIKAKLENTEDALAKAIRENFSMAQTIRNLQDLDADRVKIINFLNGRINSLEFKSAGLWTKFKSCVFGRK